MTARTARCGPAPQQQGALGRPGRKPGGVGAGAGLLGQSPATRFEGPLVSMLCAVAYHLWMGQSPFSGPDLGGGHHPTVMDSEQGCTENEAKNAPFPVTRGATSHAENKQDNRGYEQKQIHLDLSPRTLGSRFP